MNSKYDKELRPSKLVNNVLQDVVIVDVYDVIKAFNVTSAPMQHLLKKALCAGDRGHKDRRQDIVDIIDSAKRELEMIDSTPEQLKAPLPPITVVPCHNTDFKSAVKCGNQLCGHRNSSEWENNCGNALHMTDLEGCKQFEAE